MMNIMLVDAYQKKPFLISDSASGSLWVFMSALTVTKPQKAQSSSGKDISETGAILNHGSLLD